MSNTRRRAGEDPVDYWLAKATATAPAGCIEVPACKDRDGYPLVWIGGRGGRLARLSRLVLERKLGRPLCDLALHTCDNAHCVAADHLYEGTQKRNRQDSMDRGRTAKGERNGKPRRLMKEQVLEIRELDGYVSRKALAARFGIHEVTVGVIARRESWAWL